MSFWPKAKISSPASANDVLTSLQATVSACEQLAQEGNIRDVREALFVLIRARNLVLGRGLENLPDFHAQEEKSAKIRHIIFGRQDARTLDARFLKDDEMKKKYMRILIEEEQDDQGSWHAFPATKSWFEEERTAHIFVNPYVFSNARKLRVSGALLAHAPEFTQAGILLRLWNDPNLSLESLKWITGYHKLPNFALTRRGNEEVKYIWFSGEKSFHWLQIRNGNNLSI